MARSGLERVGLADRIAYEFSVAEMLPAAGQGIVAVECAAQDWQTRQHSRLIDDAAARRSADAEREVLWVLNGHCNSPIAGFSHDRGRADVADRLGAGSKPAASSSRPRAPGPPTGRANSAARSGFELLAKGAADIIERSRPERSIGFSSRLVRPHPLEHLLDMGDRGFRLDAVAEVEDQPAAWRSSPARRRRRDRARRRRRSAPADRDCPARRRGSAPARGSTTARPPSRC